GPFQSHSRRGPGCENDIGRERDQLRCIRAIKLDITRAPAGLDPHITSDRPAELLQPLQQCRETPLSLGIAPGQIHEYPDAPHPLAVLRSRSDRPRGRCAAEKRDEVAPSHSITSSARASTVGGISRPSAFAVLRLTTSSYLVGACTGKSDGFSSLRMRST